MTPVRQGAVNEHHEHELQRLPTRLSRWIVVRDNGCWEWTGPKTARHDAEWVYAQIRWDGRIWRAHRVTYFLLRGDIPDGLVSDHLCRFTLCVNPWHLEMVTVRENTIRGTSPFARSAAATHCPRGHAYTPENTTYRLRHGSLRRLCQSCHREKGRHSHQQWRRRQLHKRARAVAERYRLSLEPQAPTLTDPVEFEIPGVSLSPNVVKKLRLRERIEQVRNEREKAQLMARMVGHMPITTACRIQFTVYRRRLLDPMVNLPASLKHYQDGVCKALLPLGDGPGTPYEWLPVRQEKVRTAVEERVVVTVEPLPMTPPGDQDV